MGDLYIIAGPNGAGKSTFSHLFVPGDVAVFDGDKLLAIREKMYPDIKIGILHDGVDNHFEELIKESLQTGKDFAYETNFADDLPLATAQEFRKAGFRINLIFIGLRSAKLAEARVVMRVELGGHDVEQGEIIERYNEGLKNVRKYIGFFDRAILYSSENKQRLEKPWKVLRVDKGQVMEKAARLPAWAQKIAMDLLVKIENKKSVDKGKKF